MNYYDDNNDSPIDQFVYGDVRPAFVWSLMAATVALFVFVLPYMFGGL